MKYLIAMLLCLSLLACDSRQQKSAEITASKALTAKSSETRPHFSEPQGDEVSLDKELKTSSNIPEILRKNLEENEEQTLKMLATLEGEYDYSIIGDTLLAFYQQDPEAGLKAHEIMNANLTLATPLLAQILAAYADKNPEKAHDWLLKHSAFNGAPQAAAALGQKAGSQENPASVFEKIRESKLPSSLQENYIDGLAQSWLRHNRSSALRYLSEQESSPVLDRAFYNIAHSISAEDPAASMPWAQTIYNEGLRRSAIIETATQWSNKNPETYQSWKQAAVFPEDIMAELP